MGEGTVVVVGMLRKSGGITGFDVEPFATVGTDPPRPDVITIGGEAEGVAEAASHGDHDDWNGIASADVLVAEQAIDEQVFGVAPARRDPVGLVADIARVEVEAAVALEIRHEQPHAEARFVVVLGHVPGRGVAAEIVEVAGGVVAYEVGHAVEAAQVFWQIHVFRAGQALGAEQIHGADVPPLQLIRWNAQQFLECPTVARNCFCPRHVLAPKQRANHTRCALCHEKPPRTSP